MIDIKKEEERKVILRSIITDSDGNSVIHLEANISTSQYESGTISRVINNKKEYFNNLEKYKDDEKAFEAEYEKTAIEVIGGIDNEVK